MLALHVVELKRPGHCVEDSARDVAGPALFEAGVVVHAPAGKEGDLLARQAGDATRVAEVLQSDV